MMTLTAAVVFFSLATLGYAADSTGADSCNYQAVVNSYKDVLNIISGPGEGCTREYITMHAR